jgi:hypothetical protein
MFASSLSAEAPLQSRIQLRAAGQVAAGVLAVLGAAACASKPAPSPELMARCSQLYTMWWTYDQDPVFFGVAEKATAELALYRCQEGRYDEGIQALEDLLRHGGFHFPDDRKEEDSGWI